MNDSLEDIKKVISEIGGENGEFLYLGLLDEIEKINEWLAEMEHSWSEDLHSGSRNEKQLH